MSEISTVVEPEVIEEETLSTAAELETLELLRSRSLILASLGDEDEDDDDDEDWDDDDDMDDEDFDDDDDDEDFEDEDDED